MANTRWWKDELVYQVYPRSFQDTNDDGIGDLQGIIQHLDYLKALGVTMIWISPIYQSPMVDMGYDISDYQAIDPQFGTMADFDELLQKAKVMGIKIIMDLVVNHTSDQHQWFQAALADPQSKYRDYYIFKTTDDGQVPNNWRSIFGGSTWTPVPSEPNTYYFHTFAKQQPDLNWENPALRSAIYDMINWWLAKGIAGFRVDAITHLKKDLDWASIEADGVDGLAAVTKKGQNRPGLEAFLKELKAKTFDQYNAVTVGEAYGVPEDKLSDFIGPDGYFSMVFDFSYLNIEVKNVDEWYRGLSNWTPKMLKETIFESQAAIKQAGGWSANVLENHDQQRTLSKLIPNKHYQTPTAAKALATMYYYLPGVPFIYQGQEIGMKNFHRDALSDFKDISSINNYQMGIKEGLTPEASMAIVNFKSRDNARTPMQWTADEYGGFSKQTPWIKMGDDRTGIDVNSELADDQSVLHYYRQLSELRQNQNYHKTWIDGQLHPIETPDNVIGYQRVTETQRLTILVNLGTQAETVHLPAKQTVLLDNLSQNKQVDATVELQPYQALVLG